MNKQYTSVEEQIEFGLDSVEADRMVEIPLRDLLYVFQTLGEYIRFFHNPSHYADLEAVQRFLGDRDAGAFGPLADCYYEKLGRIIPKDISEEYDGGAFDNPSYPYYDESFDEDTH